MAPEREKVLFLLRLQCNLPPKETEPSCRRRPSRQVEKKRWREKQSLANYI
jgi:hypothetical protein